jgi:hypothetical protein
MGCRVGAYQSELITTQHPTKESLIESWRAICIRNQTREHDEENFEIQIYENGQLVWDQINDYGFVQDIPPEQPDFAIAADYLEERGFNPEVITLLRNHGKTLDPEQYDAKRQEWYQIRDQLQQEHPRRQGR